MPKDRSAEKETGGSGRDRDRGGKERVHSRVTGLIRRRTSSSSLLTAAAAREEGAAARDPAMQAFVERARKEAQTILARDLPAAVEKLGSLYDRLESLPLPEDTAGWAALSGKLIPEVLTVRSLLATVSLCFTFGVPGTSESGAASYQTDVLVQVTELTKTLTDLISDISPLTCSRSIAEFKSEMFVNPLILFLCFICVPHVFACPRHCLCVFVF